MKNINKQVEELITRDMSIQKNLKRGLINVRALGRYLMKTHGVNATLDAVISAIRRYGVEHEFRHMENLLKKAFETSVISTKDRVCSVTIQTKALRKFADELKKDDESPRRFRLIKSKKFSKVIFDQNRKEEVLALFAEEDVLKIKENLGEICVVLQEDSYENIQGLLARLTGEIALNEISISECIVCFPEFLIYVDRVDLLNAHHAILGLQESE